ncbi:MAG: hypothetical protein BM557_06155 [Flavobacterium sp. MedPE-SWcel]|nr:MAG: hypothetical protein BM557_06155 [Flavobacterium sp. MedPE-SWcel]
MIKETKASYTDYSNKDKQIRFVKMHHIGKEEFYADVATIVENAKNKNYVLFYEWIDFDIATDIEKRKARKLVGFIPSPEGYKKLLKQLGDETLVVQKNDQYLNLVNNKDFRVDFTPKELIKSYESKYGMLVLNDEDKNTPIEDFIEVKLPQEQVNEVILNDRNKYLANKIIKSNHSKIIVLYGAAHEVGLVELLQENDANWKEINNN